MTSPLTSLCTFIITSSLLFIQAGHAQSLGSPISLWQSCPSSADYASNRPILLTTKDPFNLQVHGPATASSFCTAAIPAGAVNVSAPCAEHRVYLPGPATALRPPVVVFLPGSNMEPDKHDLVLKTAAYAGYRTLGLSYDSRNNLNNACGGSMCSDNCHDEVRIETILGLNSSASVTVDPADSVLQRLYTLLVELHNDDMLDGVNDYQWDNYYTPMVGNNLTHANINWDQIIVAGFSQGAGHAAKISKEVLVQGVVLLDGANDECIDNSGATVPADWMTDPWDASAQQRRYGVTYERVTPFVVADTWQALGLGAGSTEDLDGLLLRLPPPDTATTLQEPVLTCTQANPEHASMARDECMPKEVVGGDEARSPAKAHLFSAYLHRFCYACDKAVCP